MENWSLYHLRYLLSLITSLDLKAAVSEVNKANPALFWLVVAWYIFLHPLYLKLVSCRQHKVGSFGRTYPVFIFWLVHLDHRCSKWLLIYSWIIIYHICYFFSIFFFLLLLFFLVPIFVCLFWFCLNISYGAQYPLHFDWKRWVEWAWVGYFSSLMWWARADLSIFFPLGQLAFPKSPSKLRSG